MKNLILSLISLSVSFSVSFSAFAHGNNIELTKTAIDLVLKQFQKDHPEHVDHFQGVKGWIENDESKVRVYLPDNVSFLYLCKHQDEANEVLKCEMQM